MRRILINKRSLFWNQFARFLQFRNDIEMKRKISIITDNWQLKRPFVISRSSRTSTATVTVSITEGNIVGVGECVPNARYQETVKSTIDQIEKVRPNLEQGLSKSDLSTVMLAGAARNAIDCALWDLEAKQLGKDVGMTSGLGWPTEAETVETISISTPKEMHRAAQNLAGFSTIKIKMDADCVMERITAVHSGAPNSKLLIDANESWTIDLLSQLSSNLMDLNVQMIEQPLHADHDDPLAEFQSALPIYADESCHTSGDIPLLKGKYDGINIKLDKTGGLTEAITLENMAHEQGFQIMIGCMLSTSLGIAPAMFLTKRARFIDIDAPSLLAVDRPDGIQIKDGRCFSLDPRLWGSGQSVQQTIAK